MKSSNNQENNQVDKKNLSRRKFIQGSATALAAGSVLGVGAIASAQESNSPTIAVDTSVRYDTIPGDLYNEERGYGEKDVTGWKGRAVYGATVGIVQLPANIPMLPGDMGNPTTFNFPVLYELITDIDPFWVLSDKPHPVVLEKTIEACKNLEMQGVRSIIGNCGFFANYQPEVAKEISIPFFNGSLMQLPMVLSSIGANKKVGVLTANKPLLINAPACKNCGVSDADFNNRVVIYGAEEGETMNRVTGEKGSFSPKALERELVSLAKKMVKENSDINAVILECTEFPPYAHAIQDAIRLPVWDFVTMTNFMHAGAMRKPFTGWM